MATYRPLAPCPGCSRHVRINDTSCPFCRHSFAAALTPAPSNDGRLRLTRAALFTFVTMSAGACSATVGGTDGSVDVSSVTDAPAVDRLAVDSGARDTGATDNGITTRDSGAPDDQGLSVAAYGGPFPTDAGPPDDEGAPAAEYGAPPRDAGTPDDEGGSMADYGAPPDRDASFFLRYGAPPPPDAGG